MDSITVHTVKDLKDYSDLPRKRKYTSKACSSCRKLKIRCRGQESSSGLSTCEHCSKIQAKCSWPEADRRKWRRVRSPSPGSPLSYVTDASRGANAVNNSPILELYQGDSIVQSVDLETRRSQAQDTTSTPKLSQPEHTVVQYYRYLGPTAIAPGYKKISLKVANDNSSSNIQLDLHDDWAEQFGSSVFDPRNNLPWAELIPHLLDAFFEYYGSYFCFLNRCQLENLIKADEISTFLLCSIAALSARFCNPDVFTPYYPPLPASEVREHWNYSLPFLNRAKTLLIPLLSIPSRDLVAGLLFLALAEFGDNNEAGK